MKILVIGNAAHFAECRKKLGDSHNYTFVSLHQEAEKILGVSDVVFDFIIDSNRDALEMYAKQKVTVFLNTYKLTLNKLVEDQESEPLCLFFGFNGIPTFFDREILEVSAWRHQDPIQLEKICKSLGTQYELVGDQVGFVTARVIAMIINEAYMTVHEGIAARSDVDLAIKLGTNYPYGPFEWCERIGIQHVYQLLEALHNETKDERYTICPLLLEEYKRLKQ
jgi:3-hydroxybutyryl-CoA dehydrogenase